MRITSAEEAVKIIKSGDRVFVHGGAATPAQLVIAMTNRAAELRGVDLRIALPELGSTLQQLRAMRDGKVAP